MLMLFTCILIGYLLNKKKITPPETVRVLSKLEINVLLPAMCFDTFMEYCTVSSVKANYQLILSCAGILAVAIPLAIWLSRYFTREPYQRCIYQYALAFGNYGFMGNAIMQVMFGEEMLYLYLLFTLPMMVAGYTWGAMILTPKDKRSGGFLKKLLNPTIAGILLGALLGLTGGRGYVPAFVSTAAGSLSACMGPMAMVLTGYVIGNYDLGGLLKNKKVYAATFLRLFILPGLFVGGLLLLGAGETDLVMALFAFATPLGMNTVVFPAAYGGETHTGASMAVISHTLSIVTIPLMYALLTLLM